MAQVFETANNDTFATATNLGNIRLMSRIFRHVSENKKYDFRNRTQ
jgi:hypothetical protein